MMLLKTALIAAGLSMGIASGAFAQSPTAEIGDGIAMLVTANGSLSYLGGKTGKLNATGHGMMMKYGTRLPPGSIIYRSGNRFYLLPNKKMDGVMVEERARSWSANF